MWQTVGEMSTRQPTMAYAAASTTHVPVRSFGSLRVAHAARLRPIARRHHRHLATVITARGAAAAPVDMAVLDERPVDRLPKNATGPKTWAAMWTMLKAKQVKFVKAEDMVKATSGFGKYTLLDIRPEVDFLAGHLPGAVNVQLYREIETVDAKAVLKKLQLMGFGIYPQVEENPDFIAQMKAVAKPGEKLLLVCDVGGSMEPTPNLKNGRQSRSLTAAFMLYRNGFKNVAIVEGGMTEWFKQGREVEGEGYITIPFFGVSLPMGILEGTPLDRNKQ